ncbi:MAG TPA: hypothetical protein VF925_04440 [Casimicrobiaceae bacterium]|jgi:hypothetical protein
MPRRAGGREEARDRARIAAVAARLILEHGISDWSLAKRKAAHQLMLDARAALPADDEIEDALAAHQSLFGGASQVEALARMRAEALRWMRDLAAWSPRLTGGVAAGWAGDHNEIRIELVADDAKAVELALINGGVVYRVAPSGTNGGAELAIDAPGGSVRLVVLTPAIARQRPRARGRPRPSLDAEAVEALLRR